MCEYHGALESTLEQARQHHDFLSGGGGGAQHGPGGRGAAATLACKPVPPLAGSDLPLPTRGLPGRFAASPAHWHGSANRTATKLTT